MSALVAFAWRTTFVTSSCAIRKSDLSNSWPIMEWTFFDSTDSRQSNLVPCRISSTIDCRAAVNPNSSRIAGCKPCTNSRSEVTRRPAALVATMTFFPSSDPFVRGRFASSSRTRPRLSLSALWSFHRCNLLEAVQFASLAEADQCDGIRQMEVSGEWGRRGAFSHAMFI